jgi:hypothetical protein
MIKNKKADSPSARGQQIAPRSRTNRIYIALMTAVTVMNGSKDLRTGDTTRNG